MDSVRPHFLDTNVLLRFLVRDDEEKAAAALDLLLRVERREERILTSPLVIFETIFTLQKSYGVSRSRIQSLLISVLALRDLELVDKPVHQDALELFATTNLSYADSYNVAYMRWKQINRIYSWDADFDRIQGIERIEPGT
jgi:predicted nucleic acid-binding protein